MPKAAALPPHEDCQRWDYENHPRRGDLTALCERLEKAAARHPDCIIPSGTFDTRAVHRRMFRPLAPSTCRCLAGTYRGTATCKAAHHANVFIPLDPIVGIKSQLVAMHIRGFEQQCRNAEKAFKDWCASEDKPAPEVVLLEFVELLAKLLEKFLQIHPYVNGNGHAARLLVLVLLGRAGYTPSKWGLDADHTYHDALFAYRRGDKQPLEDYILDAIAGPAPVAA